MGKNTGKTHWVQVRKCRKDHSEELIVVKGQKKEVTEVGRRGREAGF